MNLCKHVSDNEMYTYYVTYLYFSNTSFSLYIDTKMLSR